jgi:hypothetical protein
MTLMIGAINVIDGLGAVFTDEIFLEGERGTLVLDLTQWGWIHVGLGALLIAVGIGLLLDAAWARIAAIILVMINMLSQVMILPAYPFWALLVIALDVLVLWALTAHADDRLSDI